MISYPSEGKEKKKKREKVGYCKKGLFCCAGKKSRRTSPYERASRMQKIKEKNLVGRLGEGSSQDRRLLWWDGETAHTMIEEERNISRGFPGEKVFYPCGRKKKHTRRKVLTEGKFEPTTKEGFTSTASRVRIKQATLLSKTSFGIRRPLHALKSKNRGKKKEKKNVLSIPSRGASTSPRRGGLNLDETCVKEEGG